MKKLYLILICIFLLIGTLFSQSQQAFRYQALARDANGNILSNCDIGLRISVIEGNTAGQETYVEILSVTSNIYGIINLAIGDGVAIKGSFEEIEWGKNSYFIKMEMDTKGGTDYMEMGTTQLYAVPYALYAERAGSLLDSGKNNSSSSSRNSNGNRSQSGSSRTGTPNTKFPAIGDSYMNVNNGNAGIGTDNPQEKLDVNGNVKANQMIFVDALGNKWIISVDTTGTLHLADKFELCGDSLYDYRDGKYYQTIQIGTQCWFSENLNIGTRIDNSTDQTQNGIIEKYCYDDIEDSCSVYGGLYDWDEMMLYSIIPGSKGICPDGWHIPEDSEWCVLEDFVDAGTIACTLTGVWRGTDVGANLKETGLVHWIAPNNATNSSGFTALAGGYLYKDYSTNAFFSIRTNALLWSSTEDSNLTQALRRILRYDFTTSYRGPASKTWSMSLRCLQD